MATIGVITLELRITESHSLKEKRHFVKGLKDRLRRRCNVAVAEIDYQDVWQRGLVTAVTVAVNRRVAERTLHVAEEEAAALLGPYLVAATIEWLE